MADANPNFSVLFSLTLKNYRKRLTDNITNKHALWYQLKKFGFVREEEGSPSIVEPLLYGRTSTVKSFTGYDLLDFAPQAGISAAEFPWRQIYGTVSLSGEEEFKNSGRGTRVLSIVEAKVQQLETTLMLELNKELVGDGTGNGGKNFHGLALAVEASTGSWSTFGGIDPNTAEGTFWRPSVIDMSSAAFAAVGVDKMRKLFNDTSRGGKDKPTLIITTQDVYEAYERGLTINEQFIDKDLGDAGFMNIVFKKVPMIFDEDITTANGAPSANVLYMVNSNYLRLCLGKGRNFSSTPFEVAPLQDAKSSRIYVFGNLTATDRRRHGVIKNIGTP